MRFQRGPRGGEVVTQKLTPSAEAELLRKIQQRRELSDKRLLQQYGISRATLRRAAQRAMRMLRQQMESMSA